MPNLRRSSPEPPVGVPEIRPSPGMANQLLRELGPLLTEDGIDVEAMLRDGPKVAGDESGVPDMATFQVALQRAMERHNLQLSSPVGAAREATLVALRAIVTAILADDTDLAATLLASIESAPEDPSATRVAACMGVSLGLLDTWLSGHDRSAPPDLADATRLPAGHWEGGQAAADILALARKGRAFRSQDKLIIRRGGPQVLSGAALALAAATGARANLTGTAVTDVVPAVIR